jgi:hypothetical protein
MLNKPSLGIKNVKILSPKLLKILYQGKETDYSIKQFLSYRFTIFGTLCVLLYIFPRNTYVYFDWIKTILKIQSILEEALKGW